MKKLFLLLWFFSLFSFTKAETLTLQTTASSYNYSAWSYVVQPFQVLCTWSVQSIFLSTGADVKSWLNLEIRSSSTNIIETWSLSITWSSFASPWIYTFDSNILVPWQQYFLYLKFRLWVWSIPFYRQASSFSDLSYVPWNITIVYPSILWSFLNWGSNAWYWVIKSLIMSWSSSCITRGINITDNNANTHFHSDDVQLTGLGVYSRAWDTYTFSPYWITGVNIHWSDTVWGTRTDFYNKTDLYLSGNYAKTYTGGASNFWILSIPSCAIPPVLFTWYVVTPLSYNFSWEVSTWNMFTLFYNQWVKAFFVNYNLWIWLWFIILVITALIKILFFQKKLWWRSF